MLDFHKHKSDCTGCSACVVSCPVKCISMKRDEEGFLYPFINDKCIKCNKCLNICPQNNNDNDNINSNNFKQISYAAVTKDYKEWRSSASGGAFGDICKCWHHDDLVIYGASWNNFFVEHKRVDDIRQIGCLRKSKYIASELNEIFLQIKKDLIANKNVIFSGTPCQVAGLKAYLRKNYDNLLLIDIICHGVGSQSVFYDCLKILENEYGKKIISYEFRTKRSYYEFDYLQKIVFSDHACKYISKDRFIQLFLSQKNLRPSCGKHCKYRNESRQSDLTIADFKGLFTVFPNLIGDKRNYSTIVINSEKGMNVVKNLDKYMILYPCSIDVVKKYNPLFYKQTWFADDRDSFFLDYVNNHEDAIRRWTTTQCEHRRSIIANLFWHLPLPLRKIVLFFKRMNQ